MSFMEPEIIKDDWFEVNTTAGIYWVPAEFCGNPSKLADGETITEDDLADWDVARSAVHSYVEGEPQTITFHKSWFGARLSAPGYMDCTDWCAFATEEEAERYLKETYPDDEDEEDSE